MRFIVCILIRFFFIYLQIKLGMFHQCIVIIFSLSFRYRVVIQMYVTWCIRISCNSTQLIGK